ncbi:MAG: translocation/assembly module TamB domain-containing protein [Deltaproteobacteria bacterium]|nr:translocation/assembly module TamB domain-containing protein [Deltaproteobacteria bacterium]
MPESNPPPPDASEATAQAAVAGVSARTSSVAAGVGGAGASGEGVGAPEREGAPAQTPAGAPAAAVVPPVAVRVFREGRRPKKPRPRWLRWVGLGLLGTLLLGALIGYIVLRVAYNGPALARKIAAGINKGIVGRVEIDSVDWEPSAILAVLRDRTTPVVVRGVRIFDPQGRLALEIPRASGRIRPRPFMPWSPHQDILASEVTVDRATVIVRGELPPGVEPGTPGALLTVNLLAAFAPKVPTPPGQVGKPGAVIALDRVKLEHIDLDLRWPTWRAHLPELSGAATLWTSQRDRLRPVLTFSVTPSAPTGVVELPAGRTLALSDLGGKRFERVRDRPHETQFDLTMSAAGSPLHVWGAFLDDPTTRGGLRLDLEVERSGEMLAHLVNDLMPPNMRALLAVQSGGRLAVHVEGPWDDLTLDISPEDLQLGPADQADPAAPADPADPAAPRPAPTRAPAPAPDPTPAPARSPKRSRPPAGAAAATPRGLDLTQLRPILRRGHARIARGVMTVDGIQVELLGGQLRGQARLGLNDDSVDATLSLDGVRTDAALPPGLSPYLAGKLSGSFHLGGNTGKGPGAKLEVSAIDLALARSGRSAPLPSRLALGGSLDITPGAIELGRLGLSGSGLSVDLRGRVNLATRGLGLAFTLEHKNPGPLLSKSPLVRELLRGLKTSGDLTGTIEEPRVRASLSTRSVRTGPVTWPRLGLSINFGAGRLAIDLRRTAMLGGHLEGNTRLVLPGRNVRGKIERANLSLDGVELGRVAPGLGGRLDLDLGASGSFSAPSADLTAQATGLVAGGVAFKTARTRLELQADHAKVDTTLTPRAGGMLTLIGGADLERGELALSLRSPVKLPLAVVPQLLRANLAERGLIDVNLSVVGALDAPVAVGSIAVDGMRVQGEELGPSLLTLSAGDSDGDGRPDGVQTISGDLLRGRAQLSGAFALHPLEARVVLGLSELALEQLWTPLRELDGTGRATARVTLELGRAAPGPASAPSARKATPASAASAKPDCTVPALANLGGLRPGLRLDATLCRLELRLAQAVIGAQVQAARPAPLTFTAEGARVVYQDGTLATPKDRPIVIVGPKSRFQLAGELSSRALAVVARGTLEIPLLELYTRGLTAGASGSANVDVTVTGAPDRPQLAGTVQFDDASLVPRGVENTRVRLERGQIRLAGDTVSLDGLVLEVVSQNAPREAPCQRLQGSRRCLFIDGRVGLRKLQPETLDVTLEGIAGARLLPSLLPQAFADAQGGATVRVRATGALADPDLSGSLTFDRGALELVPRRLQREIILDGGRITLVPRTLARPAAVQLNLAGRVDYAHFNLRGQVTYAAFKPIDVKLTDVRARALSYRQPGVFEVEADMALAVTGDQDSLTIKGDISIVDGRYVQPLSVAKAIFLPKVDREDSPPFWKGIPYLERTRLDVSIATAGEMQVKNNLADLGLSGRLTLTGELDDPRLDGIVRVEEGSFRIPFLRGTFNVTSGTIYFDKDEKPPYDTPRIEIVAETVFVESGQSEQEHTITLTLLGPLSDVQFDLTSDTGLERTEVVSLLTIGRTPNALRQQLRGDQAVSSYSGRDSNALAAGDQLVKELTSDVLAMLVNDPLTRITSLDEVKVKVSTNCIEIEAAERLGRYVRVGGIYDCTVGQERTELYGTARVHEHATLEARAKRFLRNPELLLEEQQGWRTLGQVRFRWKIP